jgi:hypothetical protein
MQIKPNQTQYKANTKPIQTQFPKSQKMNVTSILTKDYENETAFRLRQIKPNQTQFQTGYLTALRSVAQDKCARNDDVA